MIDGSVLYTAINTEEGLEVLRPASKGGGVVSEKVLSVCTGDSGPDG